MTTNAYIEVPASYDLDFIVNNIVWGTASPPMRPVRGVMDNGDGTKRVALSFAPDTEQFDKFAQAVTDYPTTYLAVRLPQRIAEVKMYRDLRIGSFSFGGLPVILDLETKANITGSVSGLERNPQIAGIDWSLGGGNFIFLSRDMVFGLADAAFLHVQACFTRFKNLVSEMKLAEDVPSLEAINITSGWPAIN